MFLSKFGALEEDFMKIPQTISFKKCSVGGREGAIISNQDFAGIGDLMQGFSFNRRMVYTAKMTLIRMSDQANLTPKLLKF